MLSMLEVRRYEKHQIIYDELDEITEINFVIEGIFAVGYEINQKKNYRYKYRPP